MPIAYILAQLLGGITGAALVYANYFHAIDLFEGGQGVRTLKTAGLFSTYAVRSDASGDTFRLCLSLSLQLDYMTHVSAFFSEFLATAVLMMLVLAEGDPSNLAPPKGLAPVMLFLLILGIGCSLGSQTGMFGIRFSTARVYAKAHLNTLRLRN
jgi:aquaglyceroporin related protein, other eukaryote